MRRPDYQGFPPPPWKLRGEAVFAMKFVPKALARSFVPADLQIVCLYPGRTLSMLYLAQYSHSPVGQYRELIIAPAIVRRAGWIGCWISRIVVDDDRSVAAGRALWDLPKEHASFLWEASTQTRIHAAGPQLNAQTAFQAPRWQLPLPFVGAVVGQRNWFGVRGVGRIGVAHATLQQAKDSEAAALGFHGTQRLYVCSQLDITIGAPRHTDRAAALK